MVTPNKIWLLDMQKREKMGPVLLLYKWAGTAFKGSCFFTIKPSSRFGVEWILSKANLSATAEACPTWQTLYLRDWKQWFPLVARKFPLLPDHVFFLLRRQDTPIQLTAVRKITCWNTTRSDLLHFHSVCAQHSWFRGCQTFQMGSNTQWRTNPCSFPTKAKVWCMWEKEHTSLWLSWLPPKIDECLFSRALGRGWPCEFEWVAFDFESGMCSRSILDCRFNNLHTAMWLIWNYEARKFFPYNIIFCNMLYAGFLSIP